MWLLCQCLLAFLFSHHIWHAKLNHTLLTRFPLGERWPLNHNMIADNVAEGENEMNFKLLFALQICSRLPSQLLSHAH